MFDLELGVPSTEEIEEVEEPNHLFDLTQPSAKRRTNEEKQGMSKEQLRS